MYPNRWLIIWIIIYCHILMNFSANGTINGSTNNNLRVYNIISTTLNDINNNNSQMINSTNSTGTYKYLYNNLKHYFLTWYLPTVIILGIVGTVFCLVFLFLSRLFPQNMLIWLVSICFGDFFILSLEGIWMLLKVWYNYDIRDNNNFICVLHTSLSNYFFYWSAYMQSMLSLQRAYSIIRPLRARNSGPKLICLFRLWFLISICLILPILPYPLYWRVINGDCDPTNTDLYHVTTLNDFIIWGLIPLIGMTSSTVIICWNIFRLRKCFREATSSVCLHENEQKRKSSASRISALVYYLRTDDISGNFRKRSNSLSVSESALNLQMKSQCEILPKIYKPVSVHNLIDHTSRCNPKFHSQAIIRSTNPFNTRRDFATKCKALSLDQITNCVRPIRNPGYRHGATDNVGHVTRLLVCMNIWYMSSTYPLIVYLILLNFVLTNVDRDVHKFMYYLSRSLCFLNACSNWIFYCASGRLFRSRIHQMILRFMCRIRFRHRSRNSVPIPPDYTNHFKNQFFLNTSKNVYHPRVSPFFKYFSETRKISMRLNKNHGGNKINNMMHPNMEFIDNFGGRLLNSSFETVKNQKAENSTAKDISFMHNSSGKYSNNCFPLGYQCFCNLFPCSLKAFSKPSDSNKHLSVKPYPNMEKLQKDGNGSEEQNVLLGCNGCFTGFCCWRFWWYGLMAGCIKRIPNTIETVTDSDQNHSVQVLTGISTSSSVYDSCDLHRRHSEFALNNLNYKYCTHYRSTEKFRELEPKRKLELDLAIQNTFNAQINQKLHEIAKSCPSSRSFTTPNNAIRSIIDKDKSVVDYTHSDIKLPKQIIPKCFCYISSQGNRKFNYNLCQYHRDFNSSCRHHHSHHQHFWPLHSSHLHYQSNRPNTSIDRYRKNYQLPSSSNHTFSDVEVNSSTKNDSIFST
ncbi:unnamed protein product [Schistosoma mattheei]|uniref:G_PROTEIN_RECEP_F1_2 domain-containing protein n=1 Tax=Schistosoma mattheei TaxID=31246 RepID=A0AA85BCG4_9TREM|nr:unnamed protein product [Schistosoma mattheei]